MKELIILVGNIGSGKSTLCKKLQKEGYVIISRDSLRYGIGGGNYIFDLNYEPIVWDTEFYLFERFLQLGVNLVIDEVGINKILRKRYIPLAKRFNYKIVVYLLPKLTMKKSVRRRLKDPHGQLDKKLWESVWKKFNKMYEKPTLDEGFDEIRKVK
ncbi:MAG: AAA family ATPase [Candidatus Helarchaeota archaeon]